MIDPHPRAQPVLQQTQEHSFALAAMRESVDQRFDRVDQRVDRLDQRMEAGFERVEDRMSRQFMWLVGIQITTIVAMVAALVSRG
jgi:hypothetical protein